MPDDLRFLGPAGPLSAARLSTTPDRPLSATPARRFLTVTTPITTVSLRMSMLQKISRFVVGSPSATTHEATTALRQCYEECATRAAQLSRHAAMAPQAQSTEGLAELANAEAKQAERLRAALRAAGEAVAPPAATPLPHGALNHWARLVQDLEAHRASTLRLRELAVHFAETLPETAALFDDLCREEHVHCERLRGLIARADPQALD